ncbi:hypothetical protein CBR_g31484 [Chara braunii]|uniref:Integrase catalytic domain-containing protein n=1 Tax=Chara braunii TaxID=69332 RepID=A0A388LF52_CHABU|nr:hypothetical protein CBR_g31484 [Chara braunii]|eukprot:GBG80928.1 hypothetical protein CBR_g31484 [Chara braunii]
MASSADWKLQMDAAPEAEKPQYQFFYEKALKREEEEKERERRDKVQVHEVVLCTVSALTDEEVEEKTVPLLTALAGVQVAEDHTDQLAQVFKQLKELREDMAKMVQQHRDQLQQFASSQQAQIVSPLTYPASNAACQSSFAPLTMSTSSPSTSSSFLSVVNSQSGSAASPDPVAAAAVVAAASGSAGNSGTVPSPDPTMAGPSGNFAYIDRKAAQIPSKYDGKDDIESWISSMRSYFDVLGTPPSTESSILGTNVEPVLRGFLETQAVQSGYKRIDLNKWLKATPNTALEDLLIRQYADPHAAAKARLKLDKLKHSKWTGTMHSLQQYVSKLFATPDLEMTAQSCLDVIKGTVPSTLKDRLGLGLSAYTNWLTLMRDLVKLEAQDLPGGSSGKKATSRKRFPGSNSFASHDLLEADEETLVDESSLDDDQEQDCGASCSLSAHESEYVNDEESMNVFKKIAFKMLQQDDGDDLRPLEFYSKRMPSHKVAASTYMRELYVLRETLDHWKHYLLGCHFKVFSDHETLKWVQTQNNPSTTLTRWLHEIVVYDFEIKHKKGCYNRVADALSRHPEYMTCLVGSYDLRKNLKEELIEHTAKDPELSPILEQIRADPSSQPHFHKCKVLLFRRYGKHDRLCVPNHEPIMTHFLDLAHGRSGHFGVEKTYGNLLEKFVWPGMKRMAQRLISADWKDFTFQTYDMKLKMTSGRHPEANGLAEQINQTVIQLLRALIIPDQNSWDEELPIVQGLYNNSIHSSTVMTPNRLHLGWKIRNPLSYLFPEQPPGLTPGQPGYSAKFDRLLKVAVAAMERRHSAMIKHANKKRQPAPFTVGSYVWVKMSEFSEEEGVSRKLLPQYYGPWKVLNQVVTSVNQPGHEFGEKLLVLLFRCCVVVALRWFKVPKLEPVDTGGFVPLQQISGLLTAGLSICVSCGLKPLLFSRCLCFSLQAGSLGFCLALFLNLNLCELILDLLAELGNGLAGKAAPDKFSVALYSVGHKDWRSFGRAALDMEAKLHVQAPSSDRRKGAFPRGGRKGKATFAYAGSGSASDTGSQPVLQQDDGNGLRPVEYMSKKIKSQKLQDSTYEKELYALVSALKHWKHFLLGRHFKIFSDHSTLQWLKSQGELNDKLACYIQFIDMFDFELKHKKGCYNKVVDALSRRPDSFAQISSTHSFGEEFRQTIARLLPQDPTYGPIVRNLQGDPNSEPGFATSSDLLYTYNRGEERLCIPEDQQLRTLLMSECHDARGHFGFLKSYAALSQRFFWKEMRSDMLRYVETCELCQRNKVQRKPPLGLLKPLPIPDGPAQSVSIDFTDLGKTTPRGMRQVMVCVDRFSKYAEFIPLPEVARVPAVRAAFSERSRHYMVLTRAKTSAMDQQPRETTEAYETCMLDMVAEVRQQEAAATSARKKEDEEEEEQRRLAEQQQQEDAEAARKAADERRRLRRDKILESEGDIKVITSEWAVVAEEEDPPPAVHGLATTIEHVNDLVPTCAAQQEDILCVDTLVRKQARLINKLLDRVHRLEQQPTTATPAGPYNLTDHVNVLEIDVGTLKDGALATNQQIDQQICAAAARPTATTRESIPKFDGLPIFCDAANTDPIPWWRQFELKLGIHHVSNPNRHAYLYSCSGGACQAWQDDILSTHTVTVSELHMKISWADLKAAWHKRFQVEPPEPRAAKKLQRFYQNDLPSTDWITEYQRLARLVYSQTSEDHLEHLRRVLETLHRAKYKANRDKCEFVGQELEYLGHFVTPEGISPFSDKIQAIQEWSEPQNVTDVRSFLGLASYYQRFTKGYSKIAAYLTKLQCEERSFDFSEDARESFLALKVALLSAELLRIYDPLLPTRITTNVSGYSIGVVLEQHDGMDWHLAEYFSKKVPVVHSIDDARKKELLAFVHSLKRWRHFLLGRSQFRWVTNNNPLVFYKTQDTFNSTIARWMTFIDQFDFFPDHIPEKFNRFADALSRRAEHCTAVYSTFEIDDDLRGSFIRGYQADPEFRDKYGNRSSPNSAPSHHRIQEGYLLVHTWGKDLLCIPSNSHLQYTASWRVHERFWWSDLLGDVTRYCESCRVCRRCKSRNHRPYGELRPLPVTLHRREAIAMDIIEAFPKHKTGVDGILTVVDRLSKFAMFLPCRYHAKAPELAEVLYAGWIRTKDYPKEIVCDCDTRFRSDFWLVLIKRWGSSLKPSSARHPQTNGQTERVHQTAQVLLRTLICPDQKDWAERLSDVELAYNSSIHPAIGMSPSKFEHGSPVTSPLDTIIPQAAESNDHLLFLHQMQELLVKARDQMAKTQQGMSQHANRLCLPCSFLASDLVWVFAEEFIVEQDISCKLLPKWMGPWPIVAPPGDAPEGPSFTIQVPAHLPVYPIFHCSKLALYTPAEHDDFPGRRSQDPPSMDGVQEVGNIISL